MLNWCGWHFSKYARAPKPQNNERRARCVSLKFPPWPAIKSCLYSANFGEVDKIYLIQYLCGLAKLQRTSEDLGLANFKPRRIFAGRYISKVVSKFLRKNVGFIFLSLLSRVGGWAHRSHQDLAECLDEFLGTDRGQWHSTEDHRGNRVAGNLIPQKTSLQPFRICEISWKNRLTPPPHALPHCISLLAVHRRKEWFPEYEGNTAYKHSTWRKCLNEVAILEDAFPLPQGPAAAQGCFLVSETKLTVYVKETCLSPTVLIIISLLTSLCWESNPGLAYANWALIMRDVPTPLLPLFFCYPIGLTPAHTFCCLTLSPSWLYSSTTLLRGSHCCWLPDAAREGKPGSPLMQLRHLQSFGPVQFGI